MCKRTGIIVGHDNGCLNCCMQITPRQPFCYHATIYGHAALTLMCCTKGMTSFICGFRSSSFFNSARMRLFSAGRALVSCSESNNTHGVKTKGLAQLSTAATTAVRSEQLAYGVVHLSELPQNHLVPAGVFLCHINDAKPSPVLFHFSLLKTKQERVKQSH